MSAFRKVHAVLEPLRALKTRRMTNIQRVCVDIVVDALGGANVAVEELAEELGSELFLTCGGVESHPYPSLLT